jgi:LCP family protein required for cell wall assembly
VTRRTALAVGALLAWLAGSVLGSLPPVADPPVEAAPLLQIGPAHDRAMTYPSLTGPEPIFILALGSDARPGEVIDEARADSIHLIGINPAERAATVLGFPRDSWVPIPGVGNDKINAALTYGGVDLTVRTIEELTGIRIDYYALTSFGGLRAMVDQVGGLIVEVPYAMDDPYSGADFEPGRQRLDGTQALAFARNRHDTPGGDFSRSENQGTVFLSALAQFRRDVTRDPAALFTWLGAGSRNIASDVPIRELVTLAFTAYRIKPEDVRNLVVPGSTGVEGEQSVVFIAPEASGIYRDLADDGIVSPKNAPPSANG